MNLEQFMKIYKLMEDKMADNAEAAGQEGEPGLYDELMESVNQLKEIREGIQANYKLHTKVNALQVASFMSEKGVLEEIRLFMPSHIEGLEQQIKTLQNERDFLKEFCVVTPIPPIKQSE